MASRSVERSGLHSFIDQLVEVREIPPMRAGMSRPVLVLEGTGGSGRTRVLREAWRRWERRTPTVWVDPLAGACRAEGDVRQLLSAVMVGLSTDVPGYRLAFPRVVLAHIAMESPVFAADHELAKAEMRQRLNTYRDRGAVIELVGDLVRTSGEMLQTGTAPVERAVAAAEVVVGRLRRSAVPGQVCWRNALEWFGHQDQGFHFCPVEALVRLSIQAQNANAAVRGETDELLIAALLADLRESLERADRPWNAVALVDHADCAPAASFVAALVRVRHQQAGRGVAPDPLTVLTASGGALAVHLAGGADPGPPAAASRLADVTPPAVRGAGGCLRVGLEDLTVDDVERLAKARRWPTDLEASTVARAVHRLTSGHPAATDLILAALEDAPQLIDDLGAVLASPGPQPHQSVEEHLLDQMVAALHPQRRVVAHLRDDLVTLAAARDRDEAECLKPLLRRPEAAATVLFTSRTLWSAVGPRGGPALPPLLRYLLLRALAARVHGWHRRRQPACWHCSFTTLRAATEASGDLAGALHHHLALGNTTAVCTELAHLLGEHPAEEWRATLDHIVATPKMRRIRAGYELADDAENPEPDVQNKAHHVAQLLGPLHDLTDPSLSDRDTRCILQLRVEAGTRAIGGNARNGQTLMLIRPQPTRRRVQTIRLAAPEHAVNK